MPLRRMGSILCRERELSESHGKKLHRIKRHRPWLSHKQKLKSRATGKIRVHHSIKTLENRGFRSVSFRLFKEFNIDNNQELTPDESAKLPLYQIFQLYIDPIVDNIHPEIRNLLGFVPIDEPLLSLVFQKGMHTIVPFFGKAMMLPKPHVLLAMKLNSAPRRDKEHKLVKDIADIYALLWYSNISLPELKNQLFSICSKEKTR